LEPVQVWIALGGRWVACFDESGQHLADSDWGMHEEHETRQLLQQRAAILKARQQTLEDQLRQLEEKLHR
jgi:hypothetical protein